MQFSLRSSTAVTLTLTLGFWSADGSASDALAPAVESSGGTLDEIVITAEKRTERLEDAPVSASVISGSKIAARNVTDISDLNNLVPSVNLNGSFNGRVPTGMRGISSVSNEGTVGLSSGVAILVDGVPVPSDSVNGNQLEDIQNIEVLKGPQATLGGRTAASGVINIVTRGPGDTLTGSVTAVATDDKEYRVNGYVSGPLSRNVEFSLSAYHTNVDQPLKNLATGRHTSQELDGTRGKLKFKITEDLDVTLMAHYGRATSEGINFAYTYITPGAKILTGPNGPPFLSVAALLPGITPNIDNTNYASPVNAGSNVKDVDGSVVVEYRLGDYTLASTTAYQHEQQNLIQDLFVVDGYFWNLLTGAGSGAPNTPPPFYNFQNQFENITQLSEEVKLVSPARDAFNYVVGMFYSGTKVELTNTRDFFPAYNNVQVTPDTKTTDLYARANWKFLPSTSLITGLRYNYDDVSYVDNQSLYTVQLNPTLGIQGPISASGRNTSSTVVGDVTLQQRLMPDSMAYATYARGYSPGAYNTAQALVASGLLGPGTAGSPTLGYVPKETIDHFEIGSKGTYLDHRLTLNVAVWDTKYKNFQVQIFDTSTGSVNPPLILTPAGAAETRGLEFDTAWAANGLLKLNFDFAYVNAKFNEYTGAPCWYGQTAGCAPRNPALPEGHLNPLVQNLSGAVMPNAPKTKFVLGAEQRIPLDSADYELLLEGNYAFTSTTQMLADQNPQSIRPSYGLLSLSGGFRSTSGKYAVTLFVNNVLNKHYVVDMEDFWSSPWGGQNAVVSQPARDTNRYAGLRLTAGF